MYAFPVPVVWTCSIRGQKKVLVVAAILCNAILIIAGVCQNFNTFCTGLGVSYIEGTFF